MLDYHQPDARGHFGPYGGSFVAETLTHALDELKAAYAHYRDDPAFVADVGVRDGMIVAVEPGLTDRADPAELASEVIDATGRTVTELTCTLRPRLPRTSPSI